MLRVQCRKRAVVSALGALLLAILAPAPAAAQSAIAFEYEGSVEALVEIVSVEGGMALATVMLAPGAAPTEVPVPSGDYRLHIGSVRDFAFSTTELVSVPADGPVTVTVANPPESGAAAVEERRDEFYRASAIEASLAFQRRSRGRTRWIALGAGVLSGVGASLAFLQGQSAYADYQSAATTAAAAEARSEVELSSGLAVGLGAGAATGLLVGLIAQLVMPDIGEARTARRDAQEALADAEREYGAERARALADSALDREFGE